MYRSGVIVAAIAAGFFGSAAFGQDTPAQNPQPAAPQPQNQQPQDAQPPPDPVAAAVGAWELSNADHDKICKLTLRADTVASGHKADIDKACASVFPSTKDIAAWAVDNYGGLRLLNAQGEAVIELSEVESGMYDGFTPEDGRFVMQSAAAAAAVVTRSADDMVGDWSVARSTGKPICTLTLVKTPAAAGTDNMALKIKPGCDALVTRFGPTSWHMDNGELVLNAPRGQFWRFEETDNNTWQRLPESADPILLVRQ